MNEVRSKGLKTRNKWKRRRRRRCAEFYLESTFLGWHVASRTMSPLRLSIFGPGYLHTGGMFTFVDEY